MCTLAAKSTIAKLQSTEPQRLAIEKELVGKKGSPKGGEIRSIVGRNRRATEIGGLNRKVREEEGKGENTQKNC